MIDARVRASVLTFTFLCPLVVPAGEHSIGRSTGPIDYVARRQFDFFVRALTGAPTPDWNR